ncbi:MAG: hypothetical protein DMG64_14295 [Acidobacteria bacterium]|nr:MAG: hypothetical protein DMG64_14295 [Acidobacteriota bacterium]
MRKLLLLCLALFCINLWAQEVTSGSREIEFFAQGGHSVAGGRGDTTIFNAGARWGFGLFDLGRGSFQYRRNAGRAIPFAELGGGVLISNHDIPFGTNAVNFTPQLGLGVHIPFGEHGLHATLALKYLHISNAGLSVPNPGLNTIQFRFGIGKFRK